MSVKGVGMTPGQGKPAHPLRLARLASFLLPSIMLPSLQHRRDAVLKQRGHVEAEEVRDAVEVDTAHDAALTGQQLTQPRGTVFAELREIRLGMTTGDEQRANVLG